MIERYIYWCERALIWLDRARNERTLELHLLCMDSYERCIRNAEGAL